MNKKLIKKNSQTKRPGDHYYVEAKEQGFLARSVFKLQEIDKKYSLFDRKRNNDPFCVLDLGCAPGSWIQYVLPKLGPQDLLIGIDLNPITIKDDKLTFIQKDINDVTIDELSNIIKADGVDLVLSDMAPKTCGIRSIDQERSLELCRLAVTTADRMLKKGGSLVIKIFKSQGVKELSNELKKGYSNVDIFKPNSSRSESLEIFVIAKNKI